MAPTIRKMCGFAVHTSARAAFSNIFALRPGFKKVRLQDPFGQSAKTMQNLRLYTKKHFHVDGP